MPGSLVKRIERAKTIEVSQRPVKQANPPVERKLVSPPLNSIAKLNLPTKPDSRMVCQADAFAKGAISWIEH